jgi:hypothetical protein
MMTNVQPASQVEQQKLICQDHESILLSNSSAVQVHPLRSGARERQLAEN